VADLLGSNTALGDYLQTALDLSPDMYALALQTSLRNPGELQRLIQSRDPLAEICNSSVSILNFVDVPAGVNIAAVQNFICSTNFSVIISNIMQNYDVDEIAAALASNITMKPNWPQISKDVSAITELIQELIRKRPEIVQPFDPAMFGEIATSIMKSIDWKNANIYVDMTTSMLRFLKSQPYWQQMKPYILISEMVNGWVMETLARIQPENGRLDLSNLFPNATILHNLIVSALNLDENAALVLLAEMQTGPINPQKLSEIINASVTGQQIPCDENFLSDLLMIIPEKSQTDFQKLSSALCNVLANDAKPFIQQLVQSLDIDYLITSITQALNDSSSMTVDPIKSVKNQIELTRIISSFVNASEILYRDVDLRNVVARYQNVSVASFLLAVSESLPSYQLDTLGSLLDQMTPMLRSMPWWRQAEPYFRLMNIMAEVGADRTAQLPAVNITLGTIIRNASSFEALLRDGFAFAPDIITALQQAQLQLTPADYANLTDVLDLQEMLCSAEFPITVNATAVRIIICDTDFTRVLDEMLAEFALDRLIIEFGKVNQFANTTSDFSWTPLLKNTNNLAENLAVFFTTLEMPPIEEFFMYEGNMTIWYERLQKAVTTPSMDQTQILQQIANALHSMEPLFANQPGYQSFVQVAKIMEQYLDMSLNELKRIRDGGEMTLQGLLYNNTRLTTLVRSTFQAMPEVLELFMTQPMVSNHLASLLTQNDPCTADLSAIFNKATPLDVDKMRNAFCTTNMTALVEELKMAVAGYLMAPVFNSTTVETMDWKDLLSKNAQLVNIIQQLVKTPPKFSPGLLTLVNVTEYEVMFKRVANYWAAGGPHLDPSSFIGMIEMLNPLLSNSTFGQQLSKYLNAFNSYLSQQSGKLRSILERGLSLDNLFGSSTSLNRLLNATVSVSSETMETLLHSTLRGEAITYLIARRGHELCTLPIKDILILPDSYKGNPAALKDIICSLNTTVLLDEMMEQSGVSALMATLNSNTTAPVDWNQLLVNSQELSGLIAFMINQTDPLHIDPALVEAFNISRFTPFFDAVQRYDPRELIGLLEAYGPLMQELAGDGWPQIQLLLHQYSASLSFAQSTIQSLLDSGITMQDLVSNRTAMQIIHSRMISAVGDISVDSTFDKLRGEITALMKRSEIQQLVCNETALSVLLPSKPVYVNLTSVFCGVSDETWIDDMKVQNYSPNEAEMLKIAIYKWYMEQVMRRQYDFSYAFRLQGKFNPAANFTVASLGPKVRELVDIFRSLGPVPKEMFPGFNMSYYMPMIDALIQSYTRNAPIEVLRILELVDPLLREKEFWKELQTGMRAAGAYMKYINSQLDVLTSHGTNIDITVMFPDVENIRSLLSTALSPDAAAEFLTLTIYPNKLLSVVTGDPVEILCNENQFSKVFVFVSGMKVSQIQQDLCAAAQNETLVMQQVWKAFNLQKLAEYISVITGTSPEPTESPFRTVFTQADRMLKSMNMMMQLMKTFSPQETLSKIADYINLAQKTVSTVLVQDSANIGGLCDAVVQLVDETDQWTAVQPYLVRQQIVASIIADVTENLSGLDDWLCDLPNLNISTLLTSIANSQLTTISDRVSYSS